MRNLSAEPGGVLDRFDPLLWQGGVVLRHASSAQRDEFARRDAGELAPLTAEMTPTVVSVPMPTNPSWLRLATLAMLAGGIASASEPGEG
jgi:hypothetical protein